MFGAVFAHGPVAGAVGDGAWLEAMLEVEAALARALAGARLVPAETAAAITEAARVAPIDVETLSRAAARTGNPVVALVEALSAAVPKDARPAVHRGATSQDVIDTAMMLLAKRAGALLLEDLAAGADAAATLASRHRATLIAGRTLLQQALPMTFGLKAAGWLHALDAARGRLRDVLERGLYVQFGGATGTLAALQDRGVEVGELLARELGLAMPVMPWHTHRLPVLEIAGAVAGAGLVLGKIARDVTLLAQSEVGEVREAPGEQKGVSSTMPHKRNPVAAVAMLGCTRRVPGLLATLAAAGEQEHERAAGGWHVEWETFSDLLRLTGSAASWGRELLAGLEVNGERMRHNLQQAGAAVVAENLTALLAPTMGRVPALDLVRRAVALAEQSNAPLLTVLLETPSTATALATAKLDAGAVARALEPKQYLGSTDAWIDRTLAAHAAQAMAEGAHP
jgi:3-carboxy-cis,cis-muconate cycloisomerase